MTFKQNSLLMSSLCYFTWDNPDFEEHAILYHYILRWLTY